MMISIVSESFLGFSGTCGLNKRKPKKEGDGFTDSAPALVANVS